MQNVHFIHRFHLSPVAFVSAVIESVLQFILLQIHRISSFFSLSLFFRLFYFIKETICLRLFRSHFRFNSLRFMLLLLQLKMSTEWCTTSRCIEHWFPCVHFNSIHCAHYTHTDTTHISECFFLTRNPTVPRRGEKVKANKWSRRKKMRLFV